MIIVDVNGGLGNQMFQFAAGRALSLVRKVPLLLDIRSFDSGKMHQGFELDRIFAGKFTLAEHLDVQRVLGWQFSRSMLRILSWPQMSFLRNKRLVIEKSFEYCPEISSIPSTCYLKGYWQSESYFADIFDIIRSDFSFLLPMNGENEAVAREIERVNSVSIHIRRGDYVTNPKAYSVHGVCSLQYYERAISFISGRVSNPVFFVFSDDIEWVRRNLGGKYDFRFVDHNRGENSYNDMRLMSLCAHNIIANSSFSWWGAWLNLSDAKIVVAPERWFANETNTADLLPSAWVRL